MALESFYNFFLWALSRDHPHQSKPHGKTDISKGLKNLDVLDEEPPETPFLPAIPGSFRESWNIADEESQQTPIQSASDLPVFGYLECARMSEKRAATKLTNLLYKPFKKKLVPDEYIYVLSRAPYRGMYKVGYTTKPEGRYSQHKKQCYSDFVLVKMEKVLYGKRIEALIHAEFKQCQIRIECGKCRTRHQEWFIVSEEILLEAIEKWSLFSRKEPYTPLLEDGSGGELKEDVELPFPANRELRSRASRKSTPNSEQSSTRGSSSQSRQRSSQFSLPQPEDSPLAKRSKGKAKEIALDSKPKEDDESLYYSDSNELSPTSQVVTPGSTRSGLHESSIEPLQLSPRVPAEPKGDSPLAKRSMDVIEDTSSVAELDEGLKSLSLTETSEPSRREVSPRSTRHNSPRQRGTQKGLNKSLRRSPRLARLSALSASASEDMMSHDIEEEFCVHGVSSFPAKMAAQGVSM